jgi:phage regulator Rha-like protein
MDLVVNKAIGSIPAVSSKLVAEKFGKLHKDVLKAFRNLEK